MPAYISNNNEIAAETTSINNTTGNIKIEQYRYKYTGDDKYWYIRRSEGILPDRGTKAYIVTYDDNTCADTVDAWLNDPNKSQIYVRVPDASTNTKLLLAYLNSFKELVADDTNLADNASVKTQYLFKWYTPAGDIKNVYWYTRTFKSLSAETGAVKSANIAIGGVATANIADSAVKTAKLAQDAVTESKIADAAVTAKKLAPGVISGDTSVVDLKKKLEAEIQTRDNADTVLTTNLNAEESARIAADKTIKGQISDEEKARKTTDTELENKINAIQGLSTTEIDNAIKQ